MNRKKVLIWASIILLILLIVAGITVTLVLVLRKKDKPTTTSTPPPSEPTLDDIISENSTFPNGSYTISVKELNADLSGQAPLFVNITTLNSLNLRIDNSSFIAETNRLSYFFVRLPSSNVIDNSTRIKREIENNNGSIGIRFGNADMINVVPLSLSTVENSGLSLVGILPDQSEVYQLEVRMSGAMCTDSSIGSCSIVNWTPYSISSETTGSQADFNNELPVACGSQCSMNANSACSVSCSTCDGVQVAGTDTPVTRRYKMGTMAANITFLYETYTIKDRIVVEYEGAYIFDSDCVGTEGEKEKLISFEGNSVELRVDVEPNCEGTTSTAWYFTLPCVDCKDCKEYQCLDDSKAHCGKDGYLIGYGLYFCDRYYEYYSKFTPAGQAFIDCVKPGLLNYMENYLGGIAGKVDCNDLYNKAFASHQQIYLDCGFCRVFWSNFRMFMTVLWPGLIGSKRSRDAWKQVGEMAPKCVTIELLCMYIHQMEMLCLSGLPFDDPNMYLICKDIHQMEMTCLSGLPFDAPALLELFVSIFTR